VVKPATGLAVQVVLGWRQWRRKVLEKFRVRVEGFFGCGVFIVVLSLPLHLDDDPLKGVSSREVLQYFFAMFLCLIQLVVCLLDEEVELSLPQLQVPILVYSRDEGRVSFVFDSLVNPLLEGLVRAEEVPLLTSEWSVGKEDGSGMKEAGVDRLSFA
jgi:hypothetical protein